MDDSSDSPHPLIRAFRNLPAGQRRLAPLAALALVVPGGLAGDQSRSRPNTVIPPPRPAPETALAHLQERGFHDVQQVRGKLTVPTPRLADARRILDDVATTSTTWADEWEKSNSQLGQFSGNRERDAAREIARARMIGRLLRQMPGVAQADVVWDEEEAAGWREPRRTRCTVYLRPKPGYEITADVARSVRQAVAGSKKHLAAEDIVVLDLERMQTFDAVPDGVDDSLRSLAEREAFQIRQQLEAALRNCPGARVTVALTWRDRSPTEDLINVIPVSQQGSAGRTSFVASNGFLEQLSREEEPAAPAPFAPALEVTVTAPEDSAEKWASREQPLELSTSKRIAQASFEQPGKPRGSDTFRQSVCSLLSRIDRHNLATGVAVHLVPTTNATAVIPVTEDEPAVDPLWFFLLALAGCVGGAWFLSNAFGKVCEDSPATTSEPAANQLTVRPDPTARDASRSGVPPAGGEVASLEDLIDAPSDLWPQLWSEVPRETWVAALKGSSSRLRSTILDGLDPEASAELERAVALAPGMRLAEIDAAQQSLIHAALASIR